MTAVESPELKNLKGVFGDENWATFTHKDNFPNWEADLNDLDKNTLDAKLVACGFNAKNTPAMANALVVYFKTICDASASSSVSWNLCLNVPKGARVQHLRKKLYTICQDSFGYDATIEYTTNAAGAITPDADLTASVFFEEKQHALKMRNFLLELQKGRDVDFTLEIGLVKDHVCTTAVLEKHYDCKYSPDRAAKDWEKVDTMIDVSSLSTDLDDYNKSLSKEDIENESIVAIEQYTEAGAKPQWAHLKPRKGSTEALRKDTANRLVMDERLHALYDGNGSHNQPVFSVWSTATETDFDDKLPDKRKRVEVICKFATPIIAKHNGPQLNGEKLPDGSYKVVVHKEDPVKFVKLLNERHNQNVNNGFELGDRN